MNDFGGVWRKSSGFGGSQVSVINLVSGGGSISFIAGATPGVSANTNDATTGAIDTTGANLLVIAVASYLGGGTGTPTDSKSNTWNARTIYDDGGSLLRVQLFWSVPTPVTGVGSGHTASYSVPGCYPAIGFAAFSGLNATPYDTEVGTHANSANPAGGSITPSNSNSLIISAVGWPGSAGGTPTVDSSFNVIGSHVDRGGSNMGLDFAYFIQSSAAAINPTWTETISGIWAATNAVFKP